MEDASKLHSTDKEFVRSARYQLPEVTWTATHARNTVSSAVTLASVVGDTGIDYNEHVGSRTGRSPRPFWMELNSALSRMGGEESPNSAEQCAG
jgi:hypothetical protein